MKKHVICGGICLCDVKKCVHNVKHEHDVRSCNTPCLNQHSKGNFYCKDYHIVMRKIKLKKLNEIG